ncbi:CRISPR-associated endonuclease Cas3'' [Polaromonas sp. P1-6]|nr:CRISPR-associated endonuclease Cas3'' [Polaromonas sp. P1-6]
MPASLPIFQKRSNQQPQLNAGPIWLACGMTWASTARDFNATFYQTTPIRIVMLSKPLAHWRASDQTAQDLDVHLANVGYWSGVFASKINLGSAGELMGLLHDLGKYSPEFQAYIKSAEGLINPDEDDYVDAQERRGKIDHSSAGAQYVWHTLFEGSGIGALMAQFFALCIASHHSGLIDCLDANGEDTFAKRMRKAQEKTHLDEVVGLAEPAILARCAALAADPALMANFSALVRRIWELSGIAIPAQQQIGLAVRFLFSGLIDADRIDTADFEHKRVAQHRPRGNYVPWPQLIDRLENKLGAMMPKRLIDVLRNDISAHCLAAASARGWRLYLDRPNRWRQDFGQFAFCTASRGEKAA